MRLENITILLCAFCIKLYCTVYLIELSNTRSREHSKYLDEGIIAWFWYLNLILFPSTYKCRESYRYLTLIPGFNITIYRNRFYIYLFFTLLLNSKIYISHSALYSKIKYFVCKNVYAPQEQIPHYVTVPNANERIIIVDTLPFHLRAKHIAHNRQLVQYFKSILHYTTLYMVYFTDTMTIFVYQSNCVNNYSIMNYNIYIFIFL